MIKLLRVDDRLIHGQVAMVWTSYLQANLILVANDKATNDPIMKMSLSLAKPPGVDLQFRTVQDSVSFLKDPTLANKKIFVVVENSNDARFICDGVSEVNDVIFGGMRKSGDKKIIDRQVFLDRQDFDNWKHMLDLGKLVHIQVVPSERKLTYSDAEKIFNK
jgi:mannose/fructose/N-acetylgalactosamine-specific phosphotransferase system component IIB